MRHDLEARVAALEEALANLPTAGTDSLQPNIMNVHPDGTIDISTTGKVSASELDLVAGTGASPIKWLTSGGALVAQLTSDGAGNLSFSPGKLSGPTIVGGTITAAELLLNADTSDPLNPTANQIQWLDASSRMMGALAAVTDGSVWVGAGSISTKTYTRLFDVQSGSTFLRNGEGRFSTSGLVTVTWPGGSSWSNSVTVQVGSAVGTCHGVATPIESVSGTNMAVAGVSSLGGGKVGIFCQYPTNQAAPAPGAGCHVAYVAWGN